LPPLAELQPPAADVSGVPKDDIILVTQQSVLLVAACRETN
jgi:hypothetical protein